MQSIPPFYMEENAYFIIFLRAIYGCPEKNCLEYRSRLFPDNLLVPISLEKGEEKTSRSTCSNSNLTLARRILELSSSMKDLMPSLFIGVHCKSDERGCTFRVNIKLTPECVFHLMER